MPIAMSRAAGWLSVGMLSIALAVSSCRPPWPPRAAAPVAGPDPHGIATAILAVRAAVPQAGGQVLVVDSIVTLTADFQFSVPPLGGARFVISEQDIDKLRTEDAVVVRGRDSVDHGYTGADTAYVTVHAIAFLFGREVQVLGVAVRSGRALSVFEVDLKRATRGWKAIRSRLVFEP